MSARKLTGRLLILILTIFIIDAVVPQTRPIKAHDFDPLTVEQASSIAYIHMLSKKEAFLEWEGAQLSSPKVHYNLDGHVAAYVFSVLKDSKDVGYITVSGLALANSVLEYSNAPARHKAYQAAIQSTVENLGLVIDEQKPLYLGMLAYYYQLGNVKPVRLIEMGSQRIVTLDIPAAPTLQEQPSFPQTSLAPPPWLTQDNHSRTRTIEQSTISKLLYGPDYRWYRGCGPTAVANALGHWADRGYPDLVFGGSNGDYLGTIDQLADLMGTNPEGWTKLPINDDIKKFASARGYSFQSREIDKPSYSQFIAEIDAHQPVVVLVNDHTFYGDHFITGFGYEYDPSDPNYRYMIVHDTYGDTPENYWVQYGVGYSKIWFDTVIPPSIRVDTTPPSSAVNLLPSYQTSETFNVNWSGSDEGWGIKWYDLQYRDGLSGDWTDWITNTTVTQAIFSGIRGHTYFFQNRAMDIDHNQEPYPGGDGDSHTTVANYVVSGNVKGNRDLSIMSAKVTASPQGFGAAFTDHYGLYRVGLSTVGIYSFNVKGDASFGPLPPMEGVDITGDIDNLNFILPPAVELVSNGGFESGFDGWFISGTVTPTMTTAAHTGGFAVLLGENPPPSGGSSNISQLIAIPSSLEQATLSMMFKIETSDQESDTFTINLTSPKSTITHTIPLMGTGWQHNWFDLSELAGQPVQVSFEVNQDSAINPTTVYVDEISLGPASRGVSRVYLPTIVKTNR